MTDPRIPALLEERDGYIRAGHPERVADVDAVLAMLGYVVDAPETTAVEPAVERAVPPKPARRRTPK